MNSSNGIHIVGILGSVRPGNYTSMALALVGDEVRRRGAGYQLLDPSALNLPLPGLGPESPGAQSLRETVAAATGVVFATPEYHGSFSSVTKLVIENLGFPSVLAGKPVALLGVAGGVIGAVKSLEALAGVCMHVGALVLPGSVSVARVREAFDLEGKCLNPEVEKRIRSVAANMLDYIGRSICPRLALEAMVRETARV